jgi:hypothetical protein
LIPIDFKFGEEIVAPPVFEIKFVAFRPWLRQGMFDLPLFAWAFGGRRWSFDSHVVQGKNEEEGGCTTNRRMRSHLWALCLAISPAANA